MKIKKQKDHWKELLPCEKRFEVVTWVLWVAVAIFLILDILGAFGVLTIGFDAFVFAGALLAAEQACQVVVHWRTNRSLAHTSLLVAIVFGLCTIWNIVKLFI